MLQVRYIDECKYVECKAREGSGIERIELALEPARLDDLHRVARDHVEQVLRIAAGGAIRKTQRVIHVSTGRGGRTRTASARQWRGGERGRRRARTPGPIFFAVSVISWHTCQGHEASSQKSVWLACCVLVACCASLACCVWFSGTRNRPIARTRGAPRCQNRRRAR